MFVSPQIFKHVEELYDQSMYVRAYHAALQIAPLEDWEGTTARILAGRLAATVGAPKLGRKHQLLAYRHDPKDWEARYYYARMVLRYRGVLAAWQFLRRHDDDPTLQTADPKIQSDWLAFHAFVLAQLRDFERTEAWLAKAEEVAPYNVWVWVERAKVFESQGRYEDALSVLRYALTLQPWFRPTIQTSAHALVSQGRKEEALRLLEQASQHIECAWLVEQLANLQIELGQFAEARQNLERFAALSPRLEPEVIEQLNVQRADVAYLSGDYAAAIAYAKQCASPTAQQFAAKLEQGGEESRVVLPVNHVQQHKAGFPAPLATINQYYKMPVDAVKAAQETFPLTPRKWARQHGYQAREFRVTWETAVELLKRGIIFTLETSDEPLQAVIGYDAVRRTLLIRNSSNRRFIEYKAKTLLEQYRSGGPRGTALVPVQHATSLNRLPLPETEQYDLLFALQEALENQDRIGAQNIAQTMQQRFGEHSLTWQAKLALAKYDKDEKQKLVCYEKLADLFPEDVHFRLNQIACWRGFRPRAQRLRILKKICTKRKVSPLLWQAYAQELSEDARQWPEALRHLGKILRRGTPGAATVHLLADIRWRQQRFTEALELYRFAACLDTQDESFARAFFIAAQYLKQTENALEFLQGRLQRDATGQTVPTLFQALAQIGRQEEAFEMLAEGLKKFPLNDTLKFFAAEIYARHQLFEQATSLLQQAQAQAPPNQWQRTAAFIAKLRGQRIEGLQHWRQIAEAEPLSVEAARQTMQLLAETNSQQAALDYLRDRLRRYPHANKLRELLIEWLLPNLVQAEPELRLLLKNDPSNAWAQRTLSLVLLKLRRNDEALAASEAACRLDTSSENHCLRGQVWAQIGRVTEAKEDFRAAIKLSAEYVPAISHLVAASATLSEQRESLLFAHEEMTRQTTTGEAWLAFRELAKDYLKADELLQLLRGTLQEKPELPLAWSAAIAQLLQMQQVDEAFSLACQATERFPLVARSWFDLALTCELRQEVEQQILALQRALLLDPSFAIAAQRLAATHERQGDLLTARAVLEQAIIQSPFDHYSTGSLADICWKLGEKETALTLMQRALSLAPDYDWGWRALRSWAQQINQPTLALEYARTLTTQCSGDPRSWLMLARTSKGEQGLPEQLAAVERAIALNPQLIEAHSLRAHLLTEAKRYDEALRACRPAILAPSFPPELLSTEAFITAQCGDLATALKKMRALLQTEPNYAQGWEQLARWYRTLERETEYLEAAQNLARLLPQYSVAHGYLGEARLRSGDRSGAKEAFQRALTLAPDYEFVALTLFDLYLEDNNLRDAAEILKNLKQFVCGEPTKLRALKLAAKASDHVRAQKYLTSLCLSSSHYYIDTAVEVLAPTKLHKILDTVFEEALTKPEVNPYVGRLWAQRCAVQNKPDHCLKRLHQLAQTPNKLWYLAAATFVEICAQNGAAEPVQQFVRQHRELLQQENSSWSAVGVALYTLGELQATVKWQNDWRTRKDIAPEMLWNLVLALRDLNREDDAREVGLYAVNLPGDQRTNSHLALLSLDEALAGRIKDADRHAERIAPQAMNEWDQVMIELAMGLREFHQARAEGRAIGQKVVEKLLQVAQQTPWLKQSRTLVTLFKRAINNVLTNENDSMLKVKTKLKMKWIEYRAH